MFTIASNDNIEIETKVMKNNTIHITYDGISVMSVEDNGRGKLFLCEINDNDARRLKAKNLKLEHNWQTNKHSLAEVYSYSDANPY